MSIPYCRPRGRSREGLNALTEERIQFAVETAKQVKISNLDFREVLTQLPDDAAIYLDPPYWVDRPEEIYDDPFYEQDHIDLRDMLLTLDPSRHRFLLSMEISEFSRYLYIHPNRFDWIKIPVCYTYAARGHKGIRTHEYLIANFPLSDIRRDHDHVAYFSEQVDRSPELRIRGMLSRADKKVGPADRVRAFNLPLADTCYRRVNGNQIASPLCQSVCYAHDLKPSAHTRAQLNMGIAERDDFAALMTGAILDSGVSEFRIHSFGEFFSAKYIESWIQVVKASPQVRFWCFTRAWRRIDLLPSLRQLAALPNMKLLFSWDRSTGDPPTTDEIENAWLAVADNDVPPSPCTIAFRARRDLRHNTTMNPIPLKLLGNSTVCPHENGATANPPPCIECNICLPVA
jgi:hypothetical protein